MCELQLPDNWSKVPLSEMPHNHPQMVEAWQNSDNGEYLAIERGVNPRKTYSLTRFASAFWECCEPLGYVGSGSDKRSEARKEAVDYMREN